MRPGPQVRRMFGPYEHAIAEIYRRFFIDLDSFAGLMRQWVPQARNVLEVGCGEGAVTERIVSSYPAACVTAIDVSPKAGRLFRGDHSRVTFRQEPVDAVAGREPASFDLVVLCDVLHHVPAVERSSVLSAIAQSLSPGGIFLFKDWVTSPSPIHWLCRFSDTYLTGDDVSYFTLAEIHGLLTHNFGAGAIRASSTVRPWRNNVAFMVQRSPLQ